MRPVSLLSLALVAMTAAACSGSSSSPASPSSIPSSMTQAGVTGTWQGTSTDSTGQEKMTWTVTQSGTTMTGMMNVSDSSRSMMGDGTMSGTVNGTSVTFHMSVPSGGFGGMMSSCSMVLDGQGTMSADGHTMTGTYTGSLTGMMSGGMMNQMQSCGGAMANGQFTLTR